MKNGNTERAADMESRNASQITFKCDFRNSKMSRGPGTGAEMPNIHGAARPQGVSIWVQSLGRNHTEIYHEEFYVNVG